jgi:hypothetical protein
MRHAPVKRERLLTVRMTDAEYAAAERLAGKYGVSLSDLTRLLLTTEDFVENMKRWRERGWPNAATEEEFYERVRLITGAAEEIKKSQEALNLMKRITGAMLASLQEEIGKAGVAPKALSRR